MRRFSPRTQLSKGVLGAQVALWAQRGLIKSVQYGTITSNNTATSYTATITSVETTRTILIPLGSTGGTTEPYLYRARLSLTNSTTVTLTFDSAANASMTWGFVVIEVVAGLFRSLQYGTVAIAAAALSGTATITSVNTAKTLLIHLGNTYQLSGVQPLSGAMTKVVLTNATTVTADRSTQLGGDAATTGFLALESF